MKAEDRNGHICQSCGIRGASYAYTGKNGNRYYKKKCKTCTKYPNLGSKATQIHCSVCLKDFHPVCLDIDHVDGNKKNNTYSNYQVICACCHRLKSLMCHDWSTFKKE